MFANVSKAKKKQGFFTEEKLFSYLPEIQLAFSTGWLS